ncbi:polymeric immunoglobulin receptor-like [Astyanax mexicanus]|nr:polymeric immunoglobulin receptor-like [Astyanax mexicanus]
MQVRLYLIYFLIARLTTEGCRSKDYVNMDITAYVGDSLLLPCSCDGFSKHAHRFRWSIDYISGGSAYISSDGLNKIRRPVQLFNNHSPGNLSVLIPHLTEEDGGEYMCNVREYDMVMIRAILKVTVIPKPTTTTIQPTTSYVGAAPHVNQSLTYFPFALVATFIFHIVFAVRFLFKKRKDPARVQYSTANQEETVSL